MPPFVHPLPSYGVSPVPEFIPETELSAVVDQVAVVFGGLLRSHVVSDGNGVIPAKNTTNNATKF